jgi:glycosyltransferase involved in cell wall biosynthesis
MQPTPPHPHDGSVATPDLAICVSTFNRARSLQRLLAALAAQDAPYMLEVCVVDDGGSDDTEAVLREWSDRLQLRWVRHSVNAGPAAGRNTAWRLATAEIVAFTDDDCLPSAGWARSHLEAHSGQGHARRVVVGQVAADPAELYRSGRFSRTLIVHDARFFQTCNVSYPRALLAATGGFDETFRAAAGEDTELGLRCLELGAQAVYAQGALVFHGVRASSLVVTLRDTARWTDIPLVFRKHPSARSDLAYRWLFWKPSHPPAIAAAIGILVALRRPAALLLVLPWLRFRTRPGASARQRCQAS